MINFKGEVIETRSDSTIVGIPSAGCGGCMKPCGEQRVSIPGSWRQPDFSISEANYARAIIHSLGLPLAGFVGGAVFASQLGATDIVTACSAIAGLVAGVLLCKPQRAEVIQIVEAVTHD